MFFKCETASDVVFFFSIIIIMICELLSSIASSACLQAAAKFRLPGSLFLLFQAASKAHRRSTPASVRRKPEFNIWIITVTVTAIIIQD